MKKKRLLYIGVGFRNYDELIVNELSKRYNVVYINSKEYDMQHKVLYKLLRKRGKKIYDKLCAHYILKRIQEASINIDRLFVIKGEHLNREQLDYIKTHNKIEKSVLYLWDKWYAHKNIDVMSLFFNDIYSFDTKDCEDRGLKLRPLFYFKDQIIVGQTKTIDVSFVGNDHTGRYELLKRVKNICKRNGFSYKFCLLIGKIEYTKFTRFPLLKSKYSREDAEMFSESGISYEEYVKIISSSKVVVDMQYEGQTGLTMRTVESLAMGTRLITTNESIAHYKDIAPETYFIINSNTCDNDIISFISGGHNNVFELPEKYECGNALKEMI